MNTTVSWMMELTVQAGREADLQVLMAEMVAATEANEPGTLDYEWCFSDDGGTCHIFERYRDSAAMMVHIGAFGEKFAGRFLEVFAPTRFTVYGSPSVEVREALAGFGPVYLACAAGFSR